MDLFKDIVMGTLRLLLIYVGLKRWSLVDIVLWFSIIYLWGSGQWAWYAAVPALFLGALLAGLVETAAKEARSRG